MVQAPPSMGAHVDLLSSLCRAHPEMFQQTYKTPPPSCPVSGPKVHHRTKLSCGRPLPISPQGASAHSTRPGSAKSQEGDSGRRAVAGGPGQGRPVPALGGSSLAQPGRET
ncbi:hypothetical protein R6Z07F_018122 [Ovis aries]